MENNLQDIIAGADSEAPLLVIGESSTRNEWVAREVHRRSSRSGGPFVVVDCARLPEKLIESRVFGSRRRARRPGQNGRKDCLEAAHKGTLFLDKIGELTPKTLADFLLAVEKRRGRTRGPSARPANVRVVIAARRDLLAEVRADPFRQKQYSSLELVVIHLPPASER